jgi:hypothetical protein
LSFCLQLLPLLFSIHSLPCLPFTLSFSSLLMTFLFPFLLSLISPTHIVLCGKINLFLFPLILLTLKRKKIIQEFL